MQESLIKQRFHAARETYHKNAIIQNAMQDVLWNLLQSRENLGNVLELGAGCGILSKKIAQTHTFSRFLAVDLVDFTESFAHFATPSGQKIEFIQANFENITQNILDIRFDVISSNAALQWSNQRALLPKLSALLHTNGILLFSTFGKQNFKEMRAMFNVGLEYLELEDYPPLLENCKILESFKQTRVLQFNSALEVFKHLKNTGVNATKEHFRLTKTHLSAYAEKFSNKLTYDMLFILAQKLH